MNLIELTGRYWRRMAQKGSFIAKQPVTRNRYLHLKSYTLNFEFTELHSVLDLRVSLM
jgi:hypothetical protein